VSPPVGPTGLRYCSGGDDADLAWHVGVSGAFSGTHIEFSSSGRTFDTYFDKYAVTASVDRRLGERWTIGGALGSTVTGALDVAGVTSTVSPGPLGAFTASFRPLDEGDLAPFVLFTGSAAASVSWTSPPGGGASSALSAFDLRLGVVAGKTLAHLVTPYLLARAFGGPVFWSGGGPSATGTDANHYQLGAGVSVHVGRVDAMVEGVPLGELGLVVGLGFAF
jgi:hypothetical protein